jgi:hypothetical protein
MRTIRVSLQPTRERARRVWAADPSGDRRVSLVDIGLVDTGPADRNDEMVAIAEAASFTLAERRVYLLEGLGRKGLGRKGGGVKALVVQNLGLFCDLAFASNFVSL